VVSDCTCGKQKGVCKSEDHNGQPLLTLYDNEGRPHVVGMGVIIEKDAR
jgi:hypothetical protein